MISPKKFYEILKENGIAFFTGVPDSLLKDFCAYVTDNTEKENHIINSNEGAAVALACGYYLATGKPGLVYMQNSGLGNSINPLLSLADPEVYGIPLLLMIGWRGEPGKSDEPQHRKQGRVMLKMLEAMEIRFETINGSTADIEGKIRNACNIIKKDDCTFALVISDGTFEKYSLKENTARSYDLVREDAIRIILDSLSGEDLVISTTGKTSREVFEYRESKDQSHRNDFLTVGSMGHCSQIALGIAMKHPDRQAYVIDGDGAVIMHMGSLSISGTTAPENFKHIIINNGAHDSVGGQPTTGFQIDLAEIAKACGYKTALSAETAGQISDGIRILKQSKGPSLLEIRVNKGARENLGRPATTPQQNKNSLMQFLNK